MTIKTPTLKEQILQQAPKSNLSPIAQKLVAAAVKVK